MAYSVTSTALGFNKTTERVVAAVVGQSLGTGNCRRVGAKLPSLAVRKIFEIIISF